jgi:hypothetical protein
MNSPRHPSGRELRPSGSRTLLDVCLWLAWWAFAYAAHSAVYGRAAEVARTLGGIVVYFAAGAILYVITFGPRRKSRIHMFACFFIGAALCAALQYYGRQR